MKSSFIRWSKRARHAGMAAILLLALQLLSAGASGVSHPGLDDNAARLAMDRHATVLGLCFHTVGGTGPAVHCHRLTGAIRAIVPEWSPDPKETVSDDGIVAVPPRAASPRLLRSRVLPLGPPAFILFANFRS